jgi:acetyl esterase/lipase
MLFMSVIPAIDEGAKVLAGDLAELREVNSALGDLMGPPGDMRKPEGLAAARELLLGLLTANSPSITPDVRTVNGVEVRIFRPQKIDAVLLHFHGGGFAIGTAQMNDMSNADIATKCNLAVVSVDYRLAPEYPYPAGPDDCEAAAKWLIENSESEFGTSQLLVGGESAGGCLAATTLLRVRDRLGAIDRFIGANLVYGVYDLTGSPSSRAANDQSLVLRRSDMEAFQDLYLGERPFEDRYEADISPLYGDLSGLVPALFTVGGADPLRDDTFFMAARWQAAGNAAELAFYPECPHGFDMFPTKAAQVARSKQLDFLGSVAAAGAGSN